MDFEKMSKNELLEMVKGLNENINLLVEKVEVLESKGGSGKVGENEKFLFELIKSEVEGKWFNIKEYFKNYKDGNGGIISSGNISSIKSNCKKFYDIGGYIEVRGSGLIKMMDFKGWEKNGREGKLIGKSVGNFGMFKDYIDKIRKVDEVKEEIL
jgi:hypothetical protein